MTARKVDNNQKEIVAALRKMGASVLHTHDLGKGAPDLIAGFRGVNYMVEIKNGSLPPSKQALTDDEQIFHDAWRGQIIIIRSVADAEMFIRGVRSDYG